MAANEQRQEVSKYSFAINCIYSMIYLLYKISLNKWYVDPFTLIKIIITNEFIIYVTNI